MLNLNEAQTRKQLIDDALGAAGWDVTNAHQIGIEIPADGFSGQGWQVLQRRLKEASLPLDVKLPSGICDYVLYCENGEVLAVVKAKRTNIDPRMGQAQTRFYVEEIAQRQNVRPFGFTSNGLDTYFYDVGRAAERPAYGFFSREDLENLLFLREHATALTQVAINTKIVDRTYQHEARRRVSEAFEHGRRKALLVMATGTGKTRVAMALIDLFLRTDQARRILFVADRDALTQQALDDGFLTHIPHEPCVRIHSQTVGDVQGKRLFAVKLQTLNQCFRVFMPGFFDLIIFDEVHHSIFNKWNEPLHYFDSVLILYCFPRSPSNSNSPPRSIASNACAPSSASPSGRRSICFRRCCIGRLRKDYEGGYRRRETEYRARKTGIRNPVSLMQMAAASGMTYERIKGNDANTGQHRMVLENTICRAEQTMSQ